MQAEKTPEELENFISQSVRDIHKAASRILDRLEAIPTVDELEAQETWEQRKRQEDAVRALRHYSPHYANRAYEQERDRADELQEVS